MHDFANTCETVAVPETSKALGTATAHTVQDSDATDLASTARAIAETDTHRSDGFEALRATAAQQVWNFKAHEVAKRSRMWPLCTAAAHKAPDFNVINCRTVAGTGTQRPGVSEL